MKKIITILIVCYSSTMVAQLSGQYTIGGSSPDFNTITNAVNALNSTGTSGPVLFKIRPGIYNEKILISLAWGISATHEVHFTSETSNYDDVKITSSTPGICNIEIDRVKFSYLTFEATSYHSNIIALASNSKNLSVNYCVLHHNSTNSYNAIIEAGGPSKESFIIKNSFISGGEFACHLSMADTVKLENNSFINQSNEAVIVRGGDVLKILNNEITSIYDIIAITVSLGSLTPSNNYIIYGNKIDILGGTAIYVQSSANAYIVNNLISVRSNAYVHGISIDNSTNLKIYHNNFFLKGNNGTFIYSYFNTDSTEVLNNNFVFNDNALSVSRINLYSYADITSFSKINHNNYFSMNNRACFADQWNNNYGFDSNSLFANPYYISDSLPYATNAVLNNSGAYTNFDYYIDSIPRNTVNPNIGANYISDLYSPLHGTYIIGLGGNFLTIGDAINALTTNGISDTVVFELIPGTYSEQIHISTVRGLSDFAPIVFKSQSGVASDVTIENDSIVLTLYNAHNISFEYITFSILPFNDDPLIRIDGGYNKIKFHNNVFTSTSSNNNLIYAQTSPCLANDIFKCDSLLIEKNHFNNGDNAISIIAGLDYSILGGTNLKGVFIKENIFSNTDANAIYLFNQTSPLIEKNLIQNSYGKGISLSHCFEKIRISKNEIIGTNIALELDHCISSLANEGLISNNFISAGTPNQHSVQAFILQNSQNLLIYNNTFYIHYGSCGIACNSVFASINSFSCKVLNNIFMGKNYLYYVDSLTTFDYNIFNTSFYTDGTYNLTPIYNVNHLKIVSGTNEHSSDIDPVFVSSADMHATNSAIRLGLPLIEITDDFDGDPRHPLTTYIGADEICTHPYVNFSVENQCFGDSTLFYESSMLTDSNSIYTWNFNGDTIFNTTTPNNISHVFTSPGFQLISLIVENSNGCSDSLVYQLLIDSLPPISNYSFSDSSSLFLFTDLSSYSTDWMWDFGDGDSSMLQNPIHSFADTGLFHVCLTAQNGCGYDEYCDYVFSSIITNLSNFTNKSAVIFPNPANSTISFSGAENLNKIIIYDMLGNVHLTHQNPSQILDVSRLPQGVYLVMGYQNDLVLFSKQLIINR